MINIIKSALEEKAFQFAKNKHAGQRDDNGKDYLTAHVIQVVNILRQVTEDVPVLCAAWLHDTIEDTETTYHEVRSEFGSEIADLVLEVTHEGQKDSHGYYFPRLKTKEGILIKFADRLSNLSRMDSWNDLRQEHYLKISKFWKSS